MWFQWEDLDLPPKINFDKVQVLMQTQKHYKYLKSNQANLEGLAMKTDTQMCDNNNSL